MQLLYCNARSFHRTERISRPRSPTRKIHSSDSPRPHPRFSAASRIRGTCFSFPVALPWGRGPALFIFVPLKIQYSGTLRGIPPALGLCRVCCGKALCCVCKVAVADFLQLGIILNIFYSPISFKAQHKSGATSCLLEALFVLGQGSSWAWLFSTNFLNHHSALPSLLI